MKRLLLTLILSMFFMSVSAQDFEIVSVESLPADMSAREEIKTDHNDRQCALLRIATQNIAPEQREGFTFKPDLGSEVIDRANRNGEILLWVSPGLKYLLIMHRDWGQYELRLPDYVARIEALHTYKVTIKGTFSVASQVQSDASPTQQYLVFQLTPPNATLEVNDQLWSVDADGTAMKYVNFGTYTYRVRASDYFTETGKITVDDPNNTKTVTVSLKPNFATITLKVDADAEIWVNNVKKGVRSWTGQLGSGSYKIECKMAGHETTMVSKEITTQINGQTITLPAPTPIYGSLNVESVPIGATIYIDGKSYGKTPKSINETLIGQHEIRLTKENYDDFVKTVNVNRGERLQVKCTLQKQNGNPVSTANNTEHKLSSEDALNGLFTVSPGKQVNFSKGNLQYQASTNSWRFANHQWEFVGEDNQNISSFYNGWVDLFGWGTGNNPTQTSTNHEDYPAFSDWGNNGWRTLTMDEWSYLVDKRSTESGIRFVRAKVCGICGVILLPDDWKSSKYRLKNANDGVSTYDNNMISKAQWSMLEKNGAVFLPAAGIREGTSINGLGQQGNYWSSSSCKDRNKDNSSYPRFTFVEVADVYNGIYFNSDGYCAGCYGYGQRGGSVRLIRDHKP